MRVTEEFLDAAEIGAGIEQVRGEAVPELVRREIRIEPGGGWAASQIPLGRNRP